MSSNDLGGPVPHDIRVRIVPLAVNVELPRRASPRTRAAVPPGYGVQEQCLPFTAANALGLIIPAPITFGSCAETDVAADCRAFRSPIQSAARSAADVMYVRDDPRCGFSGNAFRIEIPASNGKVAVEPGISFFDREDQQDLIKLHLPYVWQTPAGVDTLFLPLINRAGPGPEVLSGVVETEWYANPVNLVLRLPPHPFHVRAGEPIAQAVLILRDQRSPDVEVVADHSRAFRHAHEALRDWQADHARDRSAYKTLARTHHGKIIDD